MHRFWAKCIRQTDSQKDGQTDGSQYCLWGHLIVSVVKRLFWPWEFLSEWVSGRTHPAASRTPSCAAISCSAARRSVSRDRKWFQRDRLSRWEVSIYRRLQTETTPRLTAPYCRRNTKWLWTKNYASPFMRSKAFNCRNLYGRYAADIHTYYY